MSGLVYDDASCGRKKRAAVALSYNALAQSCPEIGRLAWLTSAARPTQARLAVGWRYSKPAILPP